MREKLRLTRDEWVRVLAEAERQARVMETRISHLEREYRGFEEDAALQVRLTRSRVDGCRFLRERIEVHIGTIQLLRPTRTPGLPLVSVPEDIEQGLSKLIGQDTALLLTEVETWRK